MSENLFSAPVGWYADPLGLPQLRWWNGEGWTEQVAEASAPTMSPQEPMMWHESAPTPPPAPAAPAAPSFATPAPAAGPTLDQLQSPSVYTRVEDPSTYFAPSAMPVLQPGAYTILQPAAPEPEPMPVAAERPYSPRREARYNGYASFDAPAAQQQQRPAMASDSIPVWDIDTEFNPRA